MSGFKRIPVKIDAATGRQINESGTAIREADYFRLLFDETVILCCEFYDLEWSGGIPVMKAHPVSGDMTLSAFGDCDFDPATPFMFLSEESSDPAINHVNASGDWHGGADADRGKGQISFRINTNTARFDQAVKASGSQKYYFLIIGVPAGETEKSVLAYFRFKAENRPSSSSGAPVSADPEYLNALQTAALLKAAPEFSFSVDGLTNWHAAQTVADRYYRECRLAGEWSAPVALITGAQGEQGIQGLQGERGIQGVPGPQGAAGTQGEQGPQGPPGPVGPAGQTGPAGVAGAAGATGPQGPAGETPLFLSGSFTEASLSGGILTLSHSCGNVCLPFVITDNNGKNIALDEKAVSFAENQITVNLALFGTLPGTWKYAFGGLPGAVGPQGPAGAGNGDVAGPAGAVDSQIAIFDGIGGKMIKDSGKTIAAVKAEAVADSRTASINTRTDNYTLIIGDAGKTVRMNKATANTLTIPADSSVAFVAGTMIAVIQAGAGITSINGAAGVTINGVTAGTGALSGQYKGVMLIKTATDAWDVLGAIGSIA